MVWHHVEVYYHAAQDELIANAVRPLFAGLDPEPRGYYYRHWKRGPHVRLRFDTSPAGFASLAARVEDILGGYLAARPSRANLDPVELLPRHERLAQLEGESPPLLPWYPDNSIRYPGAAGSEHRDELIADFYAATNELALEITERVVAGHGSRSTSALDLMIATAHGLSSRGITRGFVSFRSHAEAFLCGFPEGRGLRESWDRQYAARAEALSDRVRAVVETLDGGLEGGLDGGADPVPFVRRWVELMLPIRRRAERMLADGRLSLDRAGGTAASGRLTDVSAFHRAVHANRRWQTEVRDSLGFSVYRVLLNLTYLQLTRIGITPAQRFVLCHFAAGAVEDRYGVSALEVVGA